MVLQTLCLLCLASQPSLDKHVSCEIQRAPLQEVLTALGKQAGIDIRVNVANRDYCSTVYVKDRPLKQVLDALASVHGLSVDAAGSPVKLVGTSFRTEQDSYVGREDSLLWNEVLARLDALADLTSKPYEPNPIAQAAKEGEHETPADWAKRRIHKWPYYLAGMWYRTASNYNPYIRGRLNMFRPLVYIGFWVHRSDSKAELEESNAWMDENSSHLSGNQIAFFVSPITYDIRIAGVEPIWPAEPCMRFPYVYSSPPPALGNMAFAKRLASWVTPADKLDSEELGKQVKEVEPPDSERWFGDKTSLATVLQSFHHQTGIDVVSDAYRISLQTSPSEVTGRNGKQWIKNLAEKEACFTRYEPGLLLVRHPAFWRLQQTEPTDASLKWLEGIAAKGRPKIPDYAQFMMVNYHEIQFRFDSASTCLTKFDPKPIQESGPALYTIGKAMKIERSFLGGEPYAIDAPAENGGGREDRINSYMTARMAPIYGASVSGVCKAMLRQGPARYLYPNLMGYDQLVEPRATDVFRFVALSMSPDQLSGELRMWFNARDTIVYKLYVP